MPNGPQNSNAIVEDQLSTRVRQIEKLLQADALTYMGPIIDDTPDLFRLAVEDHDFQEHEKLLILLETNGGYVEAAERIVTITRHHYLTVDFLVLSHAMSAGTVLAMSGDDIYMDYASMLGPIDPQLGRPGSSTLVPALGYLEQYQRLVDKSRHGTLTSAELAYLIENFDPAEMYRYEQARDLSIALLEEWLVNFKFNDWTVTETRQEPVTDEMKRDRAREIATKLNDTAKWHSHNRGISMDMARRELNLRIEDIEDTSGLHEALTHYATLLYDYKTRRGNEFFVLHWKGGYHGH